VLDIVAGAPLALDIDFFLVDFGAIYVWAGGAGLTGTPAPLATLSVPGAASGDRLGSASGAGIQLADLDGDSILDILAGASNADVGGTADTGAIYLFSGGAGLTGAVSPSATLSVPGAIAGDQLGLASGQAILVGELTGDGQLDVLAGAYAADVGGISDAGAVYLWAGGPGLTGSVGPLATLALASPLASDELGNGTGRAIQLADVTGDGQSDVIVSAILRGASDQGAVFGWTGGAALTGAVSPAWSMTGSSGDRLGDAPSQGVQLADVSGDGVLDIVAGSSNADVLGTVDAGALHVRIGGPGLSGSGVDWTLTDPGRMTGDQLGNAFSQGVHLGDVTGDGVVDVVAGASSADLTVADAGKILVWKGGPTTPGAPATLRVAGATAGDQLGFVFEGLGIQLADLTGDGVLDVVSGSITADSSRGAAYVWAGAPSLTGLLSPSATLSVPGAILNDRLGEAGGQGIQLADVDGDGVLDLVGAAEFANVALVSDTGAVYVWRGGPGISGPVGPSATLSVPGAATMDRLGG
jgi:hypothetical protein